MKINITKVLLLFAIFIFLFSLTKSLLSLDDGITGLTLKNGGVGCVCHGLHVPDTSVHVQFKGPDSVAVNQSAYYEIRIMGGPHVACGLDVAVGHGTLDTAGWETGTRTQWTPYSQNDSGLEITHNVPKVCTSDTLIFSFKYIAPGAAGFDTLFGNGNSVNGNDTDDEADRWNFAPNKRIRIYVPIGIENISTIAESYSLGQNYPNPFNPATNIDFSLQKESAVKLEIFDVTGKMVAILADGRLRPGKYRINWNAENMPSGIYFYRIRTEGFTQTKKMILIK